MGSDDMYIDRSRYYRLDDNKTHKDSEVAMAWVQQCLLQGIDIADNHALYT